MSDTIDCPKCEHEHTPSGSHEDDAGEMECEQCGFKFRVEIDYDPDYHTSCVTCEYEEFKDVALRDGTIAVARFCKYCLRCQLKERT